MRAEGHKVPFPPGPPSLQPVLSPVRSLPGLLQASILLPAACWTVQHIHNKDFGGDSVLGQGWGGDVCLARAVGSMARLQLVLSQHHGDRQHHSLHPRFGWKFRRASAAAWCLETGRNGRRQRSPEGADEIKHLKH